jgi:Ribonuclease G/E
MKKILFNATPTEKRAAVLENDKVVELAVERPDSMRFVGNIYRGKIVSILPGIQSAFVSSRLGRRSGAAPGERRRLFRPLRQRAVVQTQENNPHSH